MTKSCIVTDCEQPAHAKGRCRKHYEEECRLGAKQALHRRDTGHPMRPNSLANLKNYPPGVSGNPNGRKPATTETQTLRAIMRLARTHSADAIEVLRSIMMDESASTRDRIAAAVAMLDRGCGRPIAAVYSGGTNLPSEMLSDTGLDGAEITPLLADAKQGPVEYRRTLKAELARLDAEESAEKDARRDQLDRARAAMANGQTIDPATALLLKVKDEN
jgi:hypothetical protein